LSNDFEDLLGYESAYYIETMIKTADKPFINPGKFEKIKSNKVE